MPAPPRRQQQQSWLQPGQQPPQLPPQLQGGTGHEVARGQSLPRPHSADSGGSRSGVGGEEEAVFSSDSETDDGQHPFQARQYHSCSEGSEGADGGADPAAEQWQAEVRQQDAAAVRRLLRRCCANRPACRASCTHPATTCCLTVARQLAVAEPLTTPVLCRTCWRGCSSATPPRGWSGRQRWWRPGGKPAGHELRCTGVHTGLQRRDAALRRAALLLLRCPPDRQTALLAAVQTADAAHLWRRPILAGGAATGGAREVCQGAAAAGGKGPAGGHPASCSGGPASATVPWAPGWVHALPLPSLAPLAALPPRRVLPSLV